MVGCLVFLPVFFSLTLFFFGGVSSIFSALLSHHSIAPVSRYLQLLLRLFSFLNPSPPFSFCFTFLVDTDSGLFSSILFFYFFASPSSFTSVGLSPLSLSAGSSLEFAIISA